ncbi:hypothetical protein Droror1_Dr00001932, partial [Drosera rotundifolia]
TMTKPRSCSQCLSPPYYCHSSRSLRSLSFQIIEEQIMLLGFMLQIIEFPDQIHTCAGFYVATFKEEKIMLDQFLGSK